MRRSAIATATALTLLLATAASGGSPQGWDKVIDSPKRFKLLKQFDGGAVLDKETGLVWALTVTTVANASFHAIVQLCAHLTVGNRRGFRVPQLAELMTLIDPSQSDPALPPGHPFDLSGIYPAYTATRHDSTEIYGVSLSDGLVVDLDQDGPLFAGLWCVRGGAGANTDH